MPGDGGGGAMALTDQERRFFSAGCRVLVRVVWRHAYIRAFDHHHACFVFTRLSLCVCLLSVVFFSVVDGPSSQSKDHLHPVSRSFLIDQFAFT